MSQGSVLVIDDDEWVANLLATTIREAGYEVLVCKSGLAGLETACAVEPDCIVCDIDLPDHDGYWVARNVRTHPSRVSVTPFLFLSGLDDEASRLEGFHVGADVYMTKPFRVDEVIAQIRALVHMAERLRQRRDSMLSVPPGGEPAIIEGDLSQMSVATVLTVLELERRTGIFEVVSKKRRATLDIVWGHVVQGMVGGTKISALGAMRAVLNWRVGRFSFRPTQSRDLPPSPKALGALLIEAMRLEDEEARAELNLPPSKRPPPLSNQKITPPAIGGPPSSPADLAPPLARTPEFVRSGDAPISVETELAEWEIPSSKSIPPPAPVRAAPPPPPPRPAAPPPPGPTAQRHGSRPLPIPPLPPRLNPEPGTRPLARPPPPPLPRPDPAKKR